MSRSVLSYSAIPIDKIRVDDSKFRRPDAKAVQSLAKSIAVDGQLMPIIVRATGRGSYDLIAGLRRCLAVQSLRVGSIWALVYDADVPDEMITLIRLNESHPRRGS